MRSKFLNLAAAVLVAALVPLMFSAKRVDATQNPVYAGGYVTVDVPASQYLNVFAQGTSARIFTRVGSSRNKPFEYAPYATLPIITNREATIGPVSAATTFRIEAGSGDDVYYSVGALAAVLPVLRHSPRLTYTQFSPVTQNTTATLTAATLMGGLITSTQATGATIELTLPTGALTEAAAGIGLNQGWEWSLVNLSAAVADTVTLIAGSGHTIVGTAVIPSAHSTTGGLYGNAGRFFTRKTATDTFVTYRLR